MKKLFTLMCILALSFSSLSATDYTVETVPAPATPVLSAVIPLVPQTSTGSSVTQQIFLASELKALEADGGVITGLKFYYGGRGNNTAVPAVTRNIKIYVSHISADSLPVYEISGYVPSYRFKFVDNGSNLVHDASFTTEAIALGEVKPLSIEFNKSSFTWDGENNILLTVFDVTNTAYSSDEGNLRFVLKATEHARFVHQYWTSSGSYKASDYLNSLTGLEGNSFTSGSTGSNKDKQVRGHLYVPKTTFTFSDAAPTAPDVPTGLSATPGITTASLTWNEASGATSYKLYHSTSADGLYTEFASPATNSYNWTSLTASTTYYVKVSAVNGVGESDLSDPISFTTQSPHTHDGITFEPWSNPSAIPTSGNYSSQRM